VIRTQPPGPDTLARLMEAGSGPSSPFEGPAEPCGDFDMRIARDGTWYYRGTPILRPALCKLFASVLRRDAAGGYWLVTPVERGRIIVEDAPFLAVELVERVGPGGPELALRTNLDEWVTADADHPIRVESHAESGEPAPYVTLRPGLEAKLARPVFYQLVELAEERGGRLFVASAGVEFDLGSVTGTA